MRALVFALALAACGQSGAPPAPEAEIATTSGLDLSGHLIAQGEDFRLDSAPDIGVVLHYPEQELTVSGPYALPQATDTGALLESQGISLTLTPGACTLDGVNYTMRASVTIPNARPAEGCAFVRWDHQLVELIPQIDACIAASPSTRMVSYAARNGDDEVTVYLQGSPVFVECKVRNGQATVTPAPDPSPIAGVGEALFVRGSGGENPGGECFEAPEVRNANGELLGWMLDPMGC
jgi:hypothetical protein